MPNSRILFSCVGQTAKKSAKILSCENFLLHLQFVDLYEYATHYKSFDVATR